MKTIKCIILSVLLMSSGKVLTDTSAEQNFDSLLQAYNVAGQNYLYELKTGIHSSKTNWHDQYQFYKDKISEVLDSYVTSVPDDPKLCPEAIAVFQQYLSNITNAENVSSEIRLEETKRSISNSGISRISDTMKNIANDNKRFEQDTAIKTYCSQPMPDTSGPMKTQ
jgi:hypothetical protein